ncbi:hypothetical protein SeLEV6574_g01921 [Synchytrium endobioticum]|uniref:Uncharacterized protein n=1 Tax=Synchytrium endobioticum TaxID=286115 RepID=A0A507DAE2_9FUNG|nr:hypothetical protein SeLEV6574_g01921 [Synchytrium endobioticum]
MVRPIRHRGQYGFNVLDKSLALRKMRLNADDLVVLAVVSGNDYESNIPGKAIVTNVKIFQKIKEKGDLPKEAMLKEYLQFWVYSSVTKSTTKYLSCTYGISGHH